MYNFNNSLVTLFFLLILIQAKAFNITTLLGNYSSFSDFNNYLTQTGVAAAINSRQTITVLVVENNNLSPLKGKPQDVLANIMRVHVLLDYFDVQKLQKLPNKTMKTPTLFQTTGHANNDQGFLNVTELGSGSISLGETLGSNLVKSIASQPFNISILQISNVIIPLGIDSSSSSSPQSSSPARAPISRAPTPSRAHSPKTPSAAPVPGSGASPVPEPAVAEASPAPAPHGASPMSDAPPAADTPDGASADAPAPTNDHKSPSASSVLGVSLIFIAMLNLFLVLVI